MARKLNPAMVAPLFLIARGDEISSLNLSAREIKYLHKSGVLRVVIRKDDETKSEYDVASNGRQRALLMVSNHKG
jgi:ribosomal protein L28